MECGRLIARGSSDASSCGWNDQRPDKSASRGALVDRHHQIYTMIIYSCTWWANLFSLPDGRLQLPMDLHPHPKGRRPTRAQLLPCPARIPLPGIFLNNCLLISEPTSEQFIYFFCYFLFSNCLSKYKRKTCYFRKQGGCCNLFGGWYDHWGSIIRHSISSLYFVPCFFLIQHLIRSIFDEPCNCITSSE